MESVSGAQLSMDCEDMFKEITKKLYGEEAAVAGVEFPAADAEREFEPRDDTDPSDANDAADGASAADELRPEEHITAWGLAALMQNGFPPPGILQANFAPRLDPSAEDRWTAADEPLAWAHSRVAAYNPAQRLFKCTECECVGFLSRVAEHWLGTHSGARAFHCPLPHCGYGSSWARCVRQHLARDHRHDPAHADALLRDNPALDDLTRYLQRLKSKVDAARGERRATAEAPAAPPAAPDAGKRYVCAACPYATDRRDLFTRHENIHRDEKPFHCYLCTKQFNRADHVKKHFLRMHRDHHYDLNRIRRSPGKSPLVTPAPAPPPPQPQPAQSHAPVVAVHYYSKPPAEPPPAPSVPSPATVAPVTSIASHQAHLEYRVPTQTQVKTERPLLTKSESATTAQKAGGGVGAGGVVGATRRNKGERRYACCYCAWSGADNWCLKRHLNTHLKPFACALCEYKAARAERLATHVHKVHNKKACARCPFLADDQQQLAAHLRDQHHIESRNIKVPSGVSRCSSTVYPGSGAAPGAPSAQGVQHHHGYGERSGSATSGGSNGSARRRETRTHGAARLFGYLEASDGSGDDYEPDELGASAELPTAAAPSQHQQYGWQPYQQGTGVGAAAANGAGGGGGGGAGQQYASGSESVQFTTRDKENAAPPPHHSHHHHQQQHHALHHDHCLRY